MDSADADAQRISSVDEQGQQDLLVFSVPDKPLPKALRLFADFEQFPFQTGSTLNASGINYGLLQQQAALKRLKELESLAPR